MPPLSPLSTQLNKVNAITDILAQASLTKNDRFLLYQEQAVIHAVFHYKDISSLCLLYSSTE